MPEFPPIFNGLTLLAIIAILGSLLWLTRDRVYVCPACGDMQATPVSLEVHVASRHGGVS